MSKAAMTSFEKDHLRQYVRTFLAHQALSKKLEELREKLSFSIPVGDFLVDGILVRITEGHDDGDMGYRVIEVIGPVSILHFEKEETS